MTTHTGSPKSKYSHSPYILNRRRNLFPTDDEDSESDLGQPLSLESGSGSDNEENDPLLLKLPFGEYDILSPLDNRQNAVATPVSYRNDACSETLSPLYLSHTSQFSPSQTLKTPNDTTSKNQNIPKLARKSLLDETTSLKRKTNPIDSPEHSKILKLDYNSKVRTALFPPEADISLPTQSFYPKMEEKPMNRFIVSKEPITKPVVISSKRHSVRYRRNSGRINNGVRHKIKKPKQKKSSAFLKDSAKGIFNSNVAITEYIQDLCALKKSEKDLSTKLIKDVPLKKTIGKQVETALLETGIDSSNVEENKENLLFFTSTGLQTNQIRKETTMANKPSNLIPENKKRRISLSEESAIDNSKKFFKFSHSKGIVTMNKNMKLSVDHGKVTLLENERKCKKPRLDLDTTDLATYGDDAALPSANIESILLSLGKDNESNNSVLKDSNSAPVDTILSPISQMCDVTSGLAINSPKKCRNLTSVLNSMEPTSTVNIIDQKLFPIFGCERKTGLDKKEGKVARNFRRVKKISESQMLLDAGQKRFGYTHCAQCNIMYHMGDPDEEAMHLNYHNSESILKFPGWKNEHIVADFKKNGRIIKVLQTDSKIWIKKVKELMKVINKDLGCYEMDFDIAESQVYIYIKNKTIVGCAVAVLPSSGGHKMLAEHSGLCSEQSYPIKCGISRIWVAPNTRKQGIASCLMDTVKRNFALGTVLSNDDVAITAPTDAGAAFAQKYFKTNSYLIYYT